MSLLPNDIIMQIIRTADGGRITHKEKYGPVLKGIVEDQGWLDFRPIDTPDHYLDDLAAFLCDRRHQYESDEEYMHMVRNPEEYC